MTKRVRAIIASADKLAAGNTRLRDTIVKEVLHHDILYAIQQSDLARDLVFQGGTALRLCYGNARYSEDLDFVRSVPLSKDRFETFKNLLQKLMTDRHGLVAYLSDTKRRLNERSTTSSVAVHRWTATVEVPGIKYQKIHIEVADVPAYDPRPRSIINPYAQLGASPTLLNVSSEKEILADKIVALAGRPYIKARDIWDIKWLTDKGITLNLDWLKQKAKDYHLLKGKDVAPLLKRLDARIALLAQPETHQKFKDEMSRFLAKDQAEMWLKDDLTSQVLLMDVGEHLERERNRLEMQSEQPDSKDPEERLKAWREKYGVNDKLSTENQEK
jgi:predicted nucleotidyltransferase component of viral defense system